MMKRLLALWVVLLALNANSSSMSPINASFNFTSVTVGQIIQLIYSEVITTSYTIDPEVLGDQRLVSFRYKPADGDIKSFLENFLESLGYSIQRKNGTDFIAKIKPSEKAVVDEEVFVYSPKYREAGYIQRLLAPLFKGRFTLTRTVASGNQAVTKDVPANSAAGQIDQNADVIIFIGASREISQLNRLIPQVDTPRGDVAVKAIVYEVSRTKADASAFQILANILGGKLGISVSPDATALGTAISINFRNLQFVASLLATDTRFNAITQPRLRVRSGDTSRLVVGQEVPVLGNVTYQNGGTAVRSIDYRSAGTILEITPTLRQDAIDVRVEQQLSNFVQTATGVNDSPTLIKREIQTSISLTSGDVVVLGGLTETKKTEGRSGPSFLPFALSKSDDEATVDVLILLQLEKI